MLNQRLKAALGHAAIVIAASVGIAGSANAALYTGNWDPGYGAPFYDLGWKATALFDVPNTCLGQGNGSYSVSGNCAGLSLLSAELDFYNNTVNSDPSTSPVLESFTLATNVVIDSVDIAGGQLSGISTDFFAPVVPSALSASIAGGGAYAFRLVLDKGSADLAYTPKLASPRCLFNGNPDCGFSNNTAVGVFAPVPEPETYALMLVGLGAVGFAVRRRKSR